jgi:dihydroxyacetone kinase-like protein
MSVLESVMVVSPGDLKAALGRWCDALEKAAPELNALDARLGDGDLGATLEKCARNVRDALPGLEPRFDAVFKACATACAKASGSSFGTLLAVAFLTAAKSVGDAATLDRRVVVRLLDGCVAALAARGGAALGDKTMLDGLDAIARALDEAPDSVDGRQVAVDAANAALARYRDKPNRVGRARMFADKSVGLDDPGMVAVLRMAESL